MRIVSSLCDNNDDGEIGVQDAVAINKYLAGDKTTNINLGAADVNASTYVGVDDAVN